MLGIIGLIAFLGVAFIVNYLIGSVGQGFVEIFEKIGFGKIGSMIFGLCMFLVFISIMQDFIYG